MSRLVMGKAQPFVNRTRKLCEKWEAASHILFIQKLEEPKAPKEWEPAT